MRTECSDCVALKERIRQLEEENAKLRSKDATKFFCSMCPQERSFSSKQKCRWHVVVRHPEHFGISEVLTTGQQNCMVLSRLPKIFQRALGKNSMINFSIYYTGWTKS